MSRSLDFPPQSELLELPRLNATSITAGVPRNYYLAHEKALTAVYKGSSVRDAAKHYGVRRNTLNDIVAESLLPHLDGKLVGYRACLKHHRRQRCSDQPAAAIDPTVAPKTLAAVLAIIPVAQALIDAFRGRLPERSRSSRAFDSLFKKFMKLVQSAGWGELPMWASPDRGRRAVIRKIRTARQAVPAADMDEDPPEKEHGTRLEHLFELKPFDRLEADGHRIDVHWQALIQTPDGSWVPRVITCMWLIVFIDVASRALVAWNLVVKDNYNRFDLLRTAARSLTPWRKHELIVPNMKYHPEAWMPTQADSPGGIFRAVSLALDSAMAHIARDVSHNLAHYFRGVVNLGFPGVPEGRPYVEAFFKKVEDQIFRLLAGGFRPEGVAGEGETPTTALRAEDYPVKIQALEDLIDVAMSGYNPTGQDGLYNRSPRQVIEQYFDTALGCRSTLTADDINELVVLRPRVTIAGKKRVRQPFVKWQGGIYRSSKMRDCWDLIGDKFDASVPANDMRRMALWKDGKLFAVLHVLAPWARTAHDFETRQRANACVKRGLISWKGVEDAVGHFHAAIRRWASELRWAADEHVRSDLGSLTRHHPSPAPVRSSPLFEMSPRRPRR